MGFHHPLPFFGFCCCCSSSDCSDRLWSNLRCALRGNTYVVYFQAYVVRNMVMLTAGCSFPYWGSFPLRCVDNIKIWHDDGAQLNSPTKQLVKLIHRPDYQFYMKCDSVKEICQKEVAQFWIRSHLGCKTTVALPSDGEQSDLKDESSFWEEDVWYWGEGDSKHQAGGASFWEQGESKDSFSGCSLWTTWEIEWSRSNCWKHEV